MLILRSDFVAGDHHFGKVIYKDVFAKRSVSIHKVTLLIQFVGNALKLFRFKLDIASSTWYELPLAERVQHDLVELLHLL